ncbi:MAG: cellobiose phosphorylase [Lachnospiraceae bacterium]|nr:cellobiose phosphorylase [Lachnospiraceae bacterium]
MSGYVFKDNKGMFSLKNPERWAGLYFPLAGEHGLKSAITPLLGGDAKTDQNHFLLQPVSAEELHNNRSTRNFWCAVEGGDVWSATGASARAAFERAAEAGIRALSEKAANSGDNSQDGGRAGAAYEESGLTAGFMWHEMTRKSRKSGLSSQIRSFVPVSDNVEIMEVRITNITEEDLTITPYGAIPIYGRSADNIRDHRHVTSLLHRIKTTKTAVVVKPTLSFDERGHQANHISYFVAGVTGDGSAPEAFYPTVDMFLGEDGYDCPGAVYGELAGTGEGFHTDGYEAMGAMRFEKVTLKPGESRTYILMAGIYEKEDELDKILSGYGKEELVKKAYEITKKYWALKVNVSYHTKDKNFDNFMSWVSFQPMLRRIYGCSFLPHHDYGKGGRGWRDLWQDCLALLIMNPEGVKEMLLGNFGGVRIDGTNATIIGTKQGEFIADRNNIARVWMDHGLWPLMTTALYIDQTGDLSVLLKENTYFKDKQICRGNETDSLFIDGEQPVLRDAQGQEYFGSILEHLLVQNLTGFYEVGEHNHMRLRGADWNDAMDMAGERGESVAFTAAYAGNLERLADLVEHLREERNLQMVEVAKEMEVLFADDESLYESVERKTKLLSDYCASCKHSISGQKAYLPADRAVRSLRNKAQWMKAHIRRTEWIKDGTDGWFNSYYDNHGRAVEGIFEGHVRMMLTGQVFAVMSGTADKEQTAGIVRSADKYLYKKEVGGYRLNTDFGEVKMDLGRMFGFAYGHKENGAVFSHMTTMYANALYKQGFVKEGYKALQTLYEQASNFEVSRIYPGIPEYFDGKGRGMYHYLTGAASWYMMTVINEMFGVTGEMGALAVEPRLLAEQFDEEGYARLRLWFGRREWEIIYINRSRKEYGQYRIGEIFLDGRKISPDGNAVASPKEILAMDETMVHEVIVELV